MNVKAWMLPLCAAMLLAGTVCPAATDPTDDDEWEEVVVRRRKKKRLDKPAPTVAVPAQAPTVATPTVIVPSVVVTPVVAPAVVVPPPSPAPVAVPESPSAATAEVKPEEPPPPPEPPAEEAAEPRRLVRYFCKAWKVKDYERLWWAMSPEYRKKVSLKKFGKLFESDAEMNGGLLDENIIETAKTKDGNEGVKLELIFKFTRARHRIVTAIAERQPDGAFRIVESPFIPKDFDDL